MGFTEVWLQLDCALENRDSFRIALQADERDAELKLGIHGIRGDLQKMTQRRFRAGAIVLLQTRAAKQKPGFRGIRIRFDKSINQRRSSDTIAFREELLRFVRPAFEADAQITDFRRDGALVERATQASPARVLPVKRSG